MQEVGFAKLALRDGAIVTLAIIGWWLFSRHSAGTGPIADFTGVVLGAGLGFCAHTAHEWGHILGGRLGRSVMRSGTSLTSFSNFVYDSKLNNRPQFLLMSIMGFIPTGVAVWLFFSYLPEGELATHVARGVVLFLVFLGVVLELPLVVWALVRKDLPPVDRAAT
ncbi:hypothetical protein [Litorivivens sp.]|uniref:hypothetical protein n=2 Tax=Litorivivens sp. TaxID=2020868 RepID=UPI00356148CF